MKNKLVYIFMAACIFAAGQSFAQDGNAVAVEKKKFSVRGFYLGVRSSPQLSWMINKDDIDNDNYETRTRAGGSLGLGAGYNFNDNVGIGVDVWYTVQGRRYELNGTEYDQRLDYIKIPVMFTYNTRPATIMFLGKIGPQVNILTNAEIDPGMANGDDGTDNREQFEDLVIGGFTSAGVRYAITGNLWLDASMRLDVSFTNVEDNTYKYFPSGRADTYNVTTGIEVGLNYRIP